MPETLHLRRCAACGTVETGARLLCAACSGAALAAVEIDGHGELVSWTIVRRPATAFQGLGPIPVVLVRLSEGGSIAGRFEGEAHELAVGASVRLRRYQDDVPIFAAVAS